MLVDTQSVPYPRFSLFSLAILNKEHDAGVFEDVVQIVGIMWNPSGSFVDGWWYQVRHPKPPSDSYWMPAGCQEDCYESELRALVTIDRLSSAPLSWLPLEATERVTVG